jgi:FkbM family methyltransferase
MGIGIEVDGISMRGGIRDRAFLYRVKEGTFETQTAHLFTEAIKPGAVVLDVGAYLGYYTIVASRRTGESGRVFAVEPDPDSFAFLRYNVTQNGCRNVVLTQSALSSGSGSASLYRNPSDPSRASLFAREGSEGMARVACITAHDLLGAQRVDVVKIDVEGAEPLVLAGMAGVLEHSPAPVLFMELNPTALQEAGSSHGALMSGLTRLGFHDVQAVDVERGADGKLLLCNLVCRRGAGKSRGDLAMLDV